MGWRGLVEHDRRAVIFWSQKAACTTLFMMLMQNMEVPPVRKRAFIARSKPTELCLSLVQNRGYLSVAVARHPVTRVISCYINKFAVYAGKSLRRHDDLKVMAARMHLDICAHAGRDATDNLTTFEEFVAGLDREFAARPDPRTPIDGHIDTQVPEWLPPTGFRHDVVVHVENLTEELTALATRLGLRYDGSAHNISRRNPGARQVAYLGNVPARDLIGYELDYQRFLSPATLASIARLYAPDYQMFGYPPLPEGFASPGEG